MAVLPRVIALAAVAVLSACTTQVSGTPVAGDTLPPPEPKELTAEAVFDDLTTVDPCSRSLSTASHRSSRDWMSRPVVGSSRKTSSGPPQMAVAKSSRRFSPPESWDT